VLLNIEFELKLATTKPKIHYCFVPCSNTILAKPLSLINNEIENSKYTFISASGFTAVIVLSEDEKSNV